MWIKVTEPPYYLLPFSPDPFLFSYSSAEYFFFRTEVGLFLTDSKEESPNCTSCQRWADESLRWLFILETISLWQLLCVSTTDGKSLFFEAFLLKYCKKQPKKTKKPPKKTVPTWSFQLQEKNRETKAIFTMASEFKACLSYSKLFWHNAV